MKFGPTFTELIAASVKCWKERNNAECVLSVAVPVRGIDPLTQLPLLAEKQKFRFLWDHAPEFCIAAAGQCQHLSLAGPRRFERAQQFKDESFERLIDVSHDSPIEALPRILFSFSFFDQAIENDKCLDSFLSVQAVLPRWQLTLKGKSSWLRINALVNNESDVRAIIEQLWMKREKLIQYKPKLFGSTFNTFSVHSINQEWRISYKAALAKGIDLVHKSKLDKLVLAARQSIILDKELDPLDTLLKLRDQQTGSCRFLWQRSCDDLFFGASPERLLSINQGELRTDALAGTATKNDFQKLLRSNKDLREHEFVANSIIRQLHLEGLSPHRNNRPQLLRQGHLIHLHTPIFASANNKSPLHFVDILHPTPAVAGLPLKDAMDWIRALEPFERGGYAAPLGWIDSKNNADFRVAIRCGYLRGKKLSLIAGAGIVKGSTVESELQEVELKFDVLANQLDLRNIPYANS